MLTLPTIALLAEVAHFYWTYKESEMHHNIRQVARSRFFDEDMFFEFAGQNRDKHSVCGEGEHLTVSTFHVDELAQAFKDSLGDDFEAHRAEQISRQRGLR
jgi:hypothetical protein